MVVQVYQVVVFISVIENLPGSLFLESFGLDLFLTSFFQEVALVKLIWSSLAIFELASFQMVFALLHRALPEAPLLNIDAKHLLLKDDVLGHQIVRNQLLVLNSMVAVRAQ